MAPSHRCTCRPAGPLPSDRIHAAKALYAASIEACTCCTSAFIVVRGAAPGIAHTERTYAFMQHRCARCTSRRRRR